MTADPIHIESEHVRGVVYRTAAVFTDVEFRLPSGRWIRPLAPVQWPYISDADVPGHLRRLSGEFFCLPFGGVGDIRDPAPGWERLADPPVDVPMHGPAADADWDIVDHRKDHVTLALVYPEDHVVRRVERRITLSAHAPRAEIEVRIEARRSGRFPAAFHPILRLPDAPQGLTIAADFAQGFTYPGVIEPDRMAAEPGRRFATLSDVPKRRGGTVDLARLPLGPRTEDVALMAGMRGPVRANFEAEGFTVEIDWSRDLLPHCLMWIHDRGLDAKPWNGRYRGLGVEPLAAAFDGSWNLSAGSNPLSAQGYATSIGVEPGEPVVLNCAISVAP